MNARIKKKIKKRDGYRKYNTYYIHKLYSLFPDDEAMKYMNHMIYVIGNNIKHPHKFLVLSNVYPSLTREVNWVVRQGDDVGGVKMDYSLGVINSGNTKIQVISSTKIDTAINDQMIQYTELKKSKTEEMNNKTNSSLKEMLNDWQKEILKNLEKEILKNSEKYIKEESN